MTHSIAEWQKAAFECAREKGFHSRACTNPDCERRYCGHCNNTGFVEVDHKSPTRIAARLALIHAAISKAVECVCRGEMGLYYSFDGRKVPSNYFGECKPEGFPIELADVFLRTCDLAESREFTLHHRVDMGCPCIPVADPERILAELTRLHGLVSAVHFCRRESNETEAMAQLLDGLFLTAQATGVDLLANAELKHSYNLRPQSHPVA